MIDPLQLCTIFHLVLSVDIMKQGMFRRAKAVSMAFEKITANRIEAPIIQMPCLKLYNAWHVGIGVLSQEGHHIAYFCENLKGARQQYPFYDIEFYTLCYISSNQIPQPEEETYSKASEMECLPTWVFLVLKLET